MRAQLRSRGRLGDATLVCLLAYAGLRPGEGLALEWRHIRERRMLVEAAVALGAVSETVDPPREPDSSLDGG
jgi:integrase